MLLNIKRLIKLPLFTMLLILAGCKESFVDINNPSTLSTANYPNSVNDLDQLLTGVYASQHSTGLFGHNMLGKNFYCWDHTLDMSWQGTSTWIQLAQNNSQPNDSFIAETWRDAWKGVQRANTLLSGIDKYQKAHAVASEEAAIARIKGQALFMRAWFYYYLIGIWGESFIINGQGGEKLGVPIITEAFSSLDQTQVPRATVREVWDFMINDLKTAETLLNGTTWTGNDKYKVSSWAVKGFLGKAYVYTQEWNNAETYLKDVIDNSGKSLVPFNAYKDMFNNKNEFNEESISEISMNVDQTGWGSWGDQSAGSGIGMVIGPSYVGDDGSTSSSGWSNVFPHAKNISRFGFKEGHYFKPGTTQVNAANVDPAYVTRSLKVRADKTVDPRLWVGCLQPYVDSMTVTSKPRAISHYLDISELDMEAWSFRKYVNVDGTEYEVNVNNGSNFYWLRLADVYLLYAETLIHNGKSAAGLEYINKVKRRAYSYPVNAVSPVDYKTLTDATKASDAVLKNDPLKYERWAELFGEGNWWLDVRRWQIGEQEAAYYQKVRGGTIQWAPTDYAQPIPISEVTSNSKMRQNPGY
jgi:hypothetical protein